MRLALFVAAAAMLVASGTANSKPKQGPPGGGCPPGLAKKNPQCLPPGRYKKQFEVGQRVPYNFQGITGYEGLPFNARQRYGDMLDPQSRYLYDEGYIYRIDPTTMVVTQILQSILR